MKDDDQCIKLIKVTKIQSERPCHLSSGLVTSSLFSERVLFTQWADYLSVELNYVSPIER